MDKYEPGYGKADMFDPRKREFLFRMLFALSFLGIVQLHYLNINLGAEIDFVPLYILIGVYLVYTVAVFFLSQRIDLKVSRRWIGGAIDIFTLCAAIYFCGGIESYTFLFLGVAPLIGGIFGGYKEAFYSCVLCLVGLTVVVILGRPPSPDFNYAQTVAVRYAYVIGATILDMFILDLVLKDRNRLKIFYEISQSSSKSPALYNVLKEITQRMAEILKAEVALVFLYNESTGSLEAQQPSLGLNFTSSSKPRLQGKTLEIMTRVFQDVKPLLMSRRVSREAELSLFSTDYEVFDLVACPLVARGKSVGIIVLANKLNRWGFNRRDLTLLQLLSPHISVFLDNALLYRRSEEKVAQLTSLIRVVDAINTVSNLDQLYNLALDVIRGLFAVEKALINIFNAKTGLIETVRSFGYSEEYEKRHLSHPFESVSGCYVLGNDSAFLSMDIVEDHRCPNMIVHPETRAVLCVPIRSGKKVYGILHMASRYIYAFDEEDATLANAIGEQIGMAVESARLFEEINRLAITDDLTGLYNIRYLKRVLGEEVKRSIRYGRPLSFIMLDIDFFKFYNDQHGHPRGDEVLRILSGLLQQNTRDVDTVFRYGGEEFSVIIPEVAKQEAFAMAERIRRVIQEYLFPYEEDQPSGNLTVSMGVANLPGDAMDGDDLIDKADRALYRAKHTGRNRVCLFELGEDTPALHHQDPTPMLKTQQAQDTEPPPAPDKTAGEEERRTG
jgi:diguanylate cyclase (GGDEF)-like protein